MRNEKKGRQTVFNRRIGGYYVLIFLLCLALSIMASTAFIRIHYLADIVGGILVSELVFRSVLLQYSKIT